jgi:hypothetical protein
MLGVFYSPEETDMEWLVYAILVVALTMLGFDVWRRLVLADERTVVGFAVVTATLGVALTVLWNVHP